MSYWERISKQQILAYLKSIGVEGEVEQLHDTLGKQQVFRVKVKDKMDLKEQEMVKQKINTKFTTKIPDIQFINENFNYKYNDSHMLVYDIEAKYQNVYSAKLQVQIDGAQYGYEILFDDMKGIIEWNEDFDKVQKEHKDDGTANEFKGLVDMFNIDLQNHVDIVKHVTKKEIKKRYGRKKEIKKPKILINYDQSKGLISYIMIEKLDMDNTSFNRLVSELSSQALYVTYPKRENEYTAPDTMFIGKNGSFLSDNDMVNLTKVLSKHGVDMTDYEFTNISNLSLLPASALIRQTMTGQIKDL